MSLRTLRTLGLWNLVLLPWTAVFSAVSYAAHVRLGLGHWPHPMWEQAPSSPLTGYLESLVMWLLLAITISVLIAPWFLFQRRCWEEGRYRCRALAYLSGLVALYGTYLALNTTSFIDWWID